MLTKLGYKKILDLDSKLDIKVFIKLIELAALESEVTIKQCELAEYLNMKNQANINKSISSLISLEFISKKRFNNKTTYFLNPDLIVTSLCYKDAKEKFDKYKKINYDIIYSDILRDIKLNNKNLKEIL